MQSTSFDQLLQSIQERISRFYRLSIEDDVTSFLCSEDDLAEIAAPGHLEFGRESLVMIETKQDVRVGLYLHSTLRKSLSEQSPCFDNLSVLIEGVSHFLYVMHRLKQRQPFSLLELELQAEIDKYAFHLFQATIDQDEVSTSALYRRSQVLRHRLFECVRYVHEAHSSLGQRYRDANYLAARFTHMLEQRFIARRRDVYEFRRELRDFYQLQAVQKLSRASAFA